jgi:hypothetical protein
LYVNYFFHKEIRLKEGAYTTETKQLQFEFKPDSGDAKCVIKESGFKVDQAAFICQFTPTRRSST